MAAPAPPQIDWRKLHARLFDALAWIENHGETVANPGWAALRVAYRDSFEAAYRVAHEALEADRKFLRFAFNNEGRDMTTSVVPEAYAPEVVEMLIERSLGPDLSRSGEPTRLFCEVLAEKNATYFLNQRGEFAE